MSTYDYLQLAEEYDPLKPFIIRTPRGATIDFSNSTAVRRLNEALYKTTLDIQLTLPENRLCPPMENRLAYIQWLRDIAAHFDPELCDTSDICIVDIGTGASAVYPLVGCALWPDARFVATEIDDESLRWAAANVELNGRVERVELVQTRAGEPLLAPFHNSPSFKATFTMCNPPFYASAHEMRELAAKKALPALTVYTGAENESVTSGGEVGFVKQIIRESKESVRERCLWYTSMLGKASSVEALTAFLRGNDIHNFAVYCFVLGSTRRWLLGWSFTPIRLPDALVRKAELPGACNPASNELSRALALPPHADLARVLESIPGLSLRHDPLLRVSARSASWTRRARRGHGAAEEAEAGPVLVCAVERMEDGVAFRWAFGRERALFESFCGHVAGRLARQEAVHTV